MKLYFFTIFGFIIFASSSNLIAQTKCEIKNFYQAVEADYETKVITKLGNVEEAETILSPMKLDAGQYKIEVTRKANNFYKIDNLDIYLETRYCYEYSYSEKAILIVESNYGYDKGEIIFID